MSRRYFLEGVFVRADGLSPSLRGALLESGKTAELTDGRSVTSRPSVSRFRLHHGVLIQVGLPGKETTRQHPRRTRGLQAPPSLNRADQKSGTNLVDDSGRLHRAYRCTRTMRKAHTGERCASHTACGASGLPNRCAPLLFGRAQRVDQLAKHDPGVHSPRGAAEDYCQLPRPLLLTCACDGGRQDSIQEAGCPLPTAGQGSPARSRQTVRTWQQPTHRRLHGGNVPLRRRCVIHASPSASRWIR